MRAAALVMLAVAATGCSDKKPKTETTMSDVAADTRVLEEAVGAANNVIRSAPDCEAIKAALPEANRRLAEATAQIRTTSGRMTIDNLRKQVQSTTQLCPDIPQ